MPIADIGSIHRLRWGDVDGDKRLDLVVAPIFGPEAKPPIYDDPARLVFFDGKDDIKAGKTRSVVLARRPVIHAIELSNAGGHGRVIVLTADNQGVGMVDPEHARAQRRDQSGCRSQGGRRETGLQRGPPGSTDEWTLASSPRSSPGTAIRSSCI